MAGQTRDGSALETQTSAQFLESIGLPGHDLHSLPDSPKRFPDGCHYRLEIPSTEGPRCLEAVLDAADHFDVPVHRVSQGSGVFLLTDAELDEMAARAASARAEVSLFARPNAAWDASAMARTPGGAVVAASARGQAQLAAALDDARRAAAHGIRSVLIADIGVLAAFSALRDAGLIPSDMQAKLSVMLPVANASAAAVVQRLGANTINLATDLTLHQIGAIRAAVDVPLDIYVEVPDSIGGFSRLHEIPEIIRIAWRFTPAAAISLAHELEPYEPSWIEEPVPPVNLMALEKVARKVRIPVATGERVHVRHERRELFECQAADVLQT